MRTVLFTQKLAGQKAPPAYLGNYPRHGRGAFGNSRAPSATTHGTGGGIGAPSATTHGTGGGIGAPSAMLTLVLKLTIADTGAIIKAVRAKTTTHNLFLFTLEPPRLNMNVNKKV
jgi:hypothetical protein